MHKVIIIFLSILLPLYAGPVSIVPMDTTPLFYKDSSCAHITERSDMIFESLLNKTRTFEGGRVSTVLENIREDIKRMRTDFSWKIIDKVLNIDMREINEELGVLYQEDNAQVRAALLCESMLAIGKRSHRYYLKIIYELEQSYHYWKQQSEYPFYCVLTQNPLGLWQYHKEKQQLHDNQIESSRLLHSCYEHLGTLARTMGSFKNEYGFDHIREWLIDAITASSHSSSAYKSLPKDISLEQLAIVLRELVCDKMHDQKMILKDIDIVAIPSHWKRNWLWYSLGVSTVVAGWYYTAKNASFFEKKCSLAKQVVRRNYATYVAEPLLDIKKELLGIDGGPDSAGEQIRKLAQQLKPSSEWQEHIAQQLIDSYPKAFGDLSINYDIKEIVEKAGTLDENFFNISLSRIINQWDTGGFLFESYSNLFGKTTKAKIVQRVPYLAFLKTQMAECNLKNKAAVALEVSAQRIHETEKKLNLILALIALYPAYWVVLQALKGIKMGGGYWMPKGYDDRPIYHFLSKIKEIVDDENYLEARREDDFFHPTDCVIGKIVYMCSLLRNELQKVNRIRRMKMEEFLRKFYGAPTNQGKLIYVQKMLDEYQSWPRLIK